jgi:hypothetical protein
MNNNKGGPKTEEGKNVSKYNAIKHGLLSKEVFIENEKRKDFDGLREELYEALSPEGSVECLLVERIISNVWRLKRALYVETKTLEWYQNDYDLLGSSLGESEEQQERKSVKKMLSNESIETIQRYETTLERSVFKSLHELERLQAKRNGKDIPVPAVVDVSVDGGNGFVSQK